MAVQLFDGTIVIAPGVEDDEAVNKSQLNDATEDKITAAAVSEAISTAITAAKLAMYPVGSIYMSAAETNPGTFIGGTWAAWGAGRVPVGIDATQTEFDTAEETGGEKTHTLITAEMPSHRHRNIKIDTSSTPNIAVPNASNPSVDNANWTVGTAQNDNYSGQNEAKLAHEAVGGGEAHNNLQPYITCYMWKRTA